MMSTAGGQKIGTVVRLTKTKQQGEIVSRMQSPHPRTTIGPPQKPLTDTK